jgi:hypothetical protein
VVAAVSIIAVALVTTVSNTQHFSSMERQRTEAFDVAEAALDVTMEQLGQHWPTSGTSTGWQPQNFATEFPGAIVQVRLTDNDDATKFYDYNQDGQVFLDAQARVGKRAARVHAAVEVIYKQVNAYRGLALWVGGDMTNSGQGHGVLPKVQAEVFPPATTPEGESSLKSGTCSWYVKGSVSTTLVAADYMTFGQFPSRQAVLSDDTISAFVDLAKSSGRYFTDPLAPLFTPEGYGGLCVIQAASGEISLNALKVNSEELPGLLLILGDGWPSSSTAPTLRFGGNTQYFGIVYTEGVVSKTGGTPVIHGMLITEKDLDENGTPEIRYNDNCVRGLNARFPGGTRLVPGYWRELRPTI